jgi:rubrerythrin
MSLRSRLLAAFGRQHDQFHECRACGTAVEEGTDECPACGRSEIAAITLSAE